MSSSSSPRRTIYGTAALVLALVLGVTTGPASVHSLHEDQVGSFDWHQQFLGKVTQAAFAGTKGNKRAFVSTEQGAIGALSYKTGEIGTCTHPGREYELRSIDRSIEGFFRTTRPTPLRAPLTCMRPSAVSNVLCIFFFFNNTPQ